MAMASLLETNVFVKDGSLEVKSVTEFTPDFITERDAAKPILNERDECGDDQLWCDLVSPSTGHMLVWETTKAHTQKMEFH
jgi:hypothetical protein